MNEPTNKTGYKKFSGESREDFLIDPNYDFYEVLEPTDENYNELKEVARLYSRQIRTIFQFMLSRTNHKNPKKAYMMMVACCYALGMEDLVGAKSRRKLAKDMNISHGLLSHYGKLLKDEMAGTLDDYKDLF